MGGDIAKMLIAAVADINPTMPHPGKEMRHITPLGLAVQTMPGDADLVREMLGAGARASLGYASALTMVKYDFKIYRDYKTPRDPEILTLLEEAAAKEEA